MMCDSRYSTRPLDARTTRAQTQRMSSYLPVPALLPMLAALASTQSYACERDWGDVPDGAVTTATQAGMWSMLRAWDESGKSVPHGFPPPLLALVPPDEFERNCWAPSCSAASPDEGCVCGCTVFPHETAVIIFDATPWGSVQSLRLPLQSTIAHETLHVLLYDAVGSYDAEHTSPEWKQLGPRALAILAEQGFIEETEKEVYDRHHDES